MSDGVRVTTYTPTLLGSEGSAGGPYVMHSASYTIGPGGRGQRPVKISVYTYTSTHFRNSVYGCGRGLRGPVGVGWCACDKTNTINHVHAHLVGFGGVCRGYAQCFGHYRTWGAGSTATT